MMPCKAKTTQYSERESRVLGSIPQRSTAPKNLSKKKIVYLSSEQTMGSLQQGDFS
jgi:hypothetical protein